MDSPLTRYDAQVRALENRLRNLQGNLVTAQREREQALEQVTERGREFEVVRGEHEQALDQLRTQIGTLQGNLEIAQREREQALERERERDRIAEEGDRERDQLRTQIGTLQGNLEAAQREREQALKRENASEKEIAEIRKSQEKIKNDLRSKYEKELENLRDELLKAQGDTKVAQQKLNTLYNIGGRVLKAKDPNISEESRSFLTAIIAFATIGQQPRGKTEEEQLETIKSTVMATFEKRLDQKIIEPGLINWESLFETAQSGKCDLIGLKDIGHGIYSSLEGRGL